VAAVSMGSLASGLPRDIVQKLVEAEREPIKKLEVRKKEEESKLKLAQEVNTKVSDVSSSIKDLLRFRTFRDLKASNPRPEIMDVTVDKLVAEPGAYQIEVKQLAGQSSMMSNAFEDPDDTQIGAGYFSYELPNGDTKEVYISPENSTLRGIAETINAQRDLDLNAIVVNDGVGEDECWRLIVNHKKTGEVNDAEFPSFYFVDGDEDFYLEQERMAQNSVVSVNGFNVEFEGNKVSTLLPGVVLDLKEAMPGKEFTLKIEEDSQSIKGKVEAVVQKLNEVLQFVQNQNKIDKDTNTRVTLGGDITLQTLEYKIRQLVITPIQTEYGGVRFADLGVQFNRQGLLDFKQEKLDHILAANFDAVSQYFVGMEDGGDGFARRLDEACRTMTRDSGVVNSRVEGIKARIKDIDQQIERKERHIEKTAEILKNKFAQLESNMAKLRGQQNQVAAALGGGNSVLPGM